MIFGKTLVSKFQINTILNPNYSRILFYEVSHNFLNQLNGKENIIGSNSNSNSNRRCNSCVEYYLETT